MTERAAPQPLLASPPQALVVRRDIIVIGASAGGLEALLKIVSRHPADLPASVFVVLHLPAGARSALAGILTRAGRLPAVPVEDGTEIVRGRIYVAPPNRYHVILEAGRVRLVFGPRENRTRPAADPLFRSAARTYGRRVIGVVLSGAGADGADGLKAIAAGGGFGIVQDPEDAQFSGMPHVSIRGGVGAAVLPAAEIGDLLVELVLGPDPPPGGPPVDDRPPDPLPDPPIPSDRDYSFVEPAGLLLSQMPRRQGEAVGFMCPDCGGPIWQVHEDGQRRFACRVGHDWSDANSLAESQSVELERLAWGFINALAERALLMELMSEEAAEGEDNLAMRAESVWRDARRLSAVIVQRLPTVL